MTEIMKTIYKCFTLLAAIVLLAGCIQEEIPEVKASVEITARMECDADTRTSLSGLENGMYYPLWSAGDEIAVYADDDKDPSKFTIKSGDGSTVATFSGSRQGSEYLAVYPYDIAGSYANDTLSVILPQTQKYVKDSFGLGAFPMLASGSSGEGLRFMNLCSVLKISLTGTAAVRNVTLTANDENTFLSGAASVVVENAGTDKDLLVMSAGASRSVVLETKGLEISEDSPADVFIVLPSQIYKDGLTIEVDTYTDTVSRVIESDIVFERSQIRAITNFELDSEVPDIIPEAIPDNEIWYVSDNDGTIHIGEDSYFGANIIEHIYENGLGIIRFDGAVTELASLGTPNLVKIYLPSSITAVHGNPFLGSDKLVEIHGDLASDDNKCLIWNNELRSFAPYGVEEYFIPDGVISIGEMAFAFNEYLRKIVIPEGVKRLQNDVFFCEDITDTKLEEVYLPSTLESMGSYVFARCRNIKKFHGSNQFISDDGYSIIIDNYNGLGKRYLVAFASGAGLSSYMIPDGVEAIESYSFCSAEELRELTFPKTLVDIASADAFIGTYNVEKIYGENVQDDNISLVYNGTLLYVAPKGLTDYTTPAGVTNLSYGVLAQKPELVNVVISDEVTTVDANLVGCEMSVGYILWNCPNLRTVTVSARMTWLGLDPWGISLNESLTTVYLRAPIPPGIDHNFPSDIQSYFPNLTIYVPEESYDLYMSSSAWKPYSQWFEPYDYGDLSEFYPDCYISSDYSQDGKVKTLQTASKGNGIDIVLMGDAYSDREIADGSYEADMEYMYDNLFTQEPFKTHKDMFNVYYVNVVSMTEGYDYAGAALGGYFGDGTLVGGNDNKCFEYALNAISEDEMDEALIIVAMNSDAYAGTCYMYYPESATDTYGSGPSISYFPRGGDAETFAQLLHHEANGHGFAKLADEYAYEDMGAAPTDYVTQTRDQQNNWGWWKNVDFTSDPEQVRWSYFLEDERYANEGLGVFEGGLTYWSGVWRPTEDSIMRYNTGGFNAPSREAIYYRIHKLAYGDSWEYDYEDYVEYDAVNRASSASAPQKSRGNYVERRFEPTAPPVIVNKSWRDVK